MAKGLAQRAFFPLAGALLVIGLTAARPLAVTPPGPAGWKIRLTTTVKGGYAIKGENAPISGEYACRARWEGRLEADGDDFLLYHIKTEILEWRLAERAARPGGESVLEEKDTAVKPTLRLNYVLRQGTGVEVDFALKGIPVPLHPFPVKVALEFPSSEVRRILFPSSGYAAFVTRGSNRVVIPASDLLRPAAERSFSWEWRRDMRVAAGSGTCMVTERHAGEAVVSLVAY